MSRLATLLLLGLVSAAAARPATASPRAADAACDDVHIFLARGTGEDYPGRQISVVYAICNGTDAACGYEDIVYPASYFFPACESSPPPLYVCVCPGVPKCVYVCPQGKGKYKKEKRRFQKNKNKTCLRGVNGILIFVSSAPDCVSEGDGVTNGTAQITAYAAQCPDAQLVLSGYSQVSHDAPAPQASPG